MEIIGCIAAAATYYRGALALNAVATENVTLPVALEGTNGNGLNIISGITINSKENLAWELQFWGSSAFQTTNPDTDLFLGRWAFAAGDGVQDAATGLFRYYIDGLNMPYQDENNTGKLHMALVNRSAAAKTAGDAGGIRIIVWASPMEYGIA